MAGSAFSIRAARVALVWGACACSSPHGMLIGFQATAGATDVEVFLGDTAVTSGSGDGCTTTGICTISPPLQGSARLDLEGPGWTSALSVATHAKLDGHSVGWLELDTSGALDTAEALIAVAYDGETPTAVAVRNDVAIVPGTTVEIPMVAASSIDGPVAGARVDVWRRPGDTTRQRSACVAVEVGTGAFEFIVPEDDTDCDSAIDCPDTRWEYCGVSQESTVAATTCLTETTSGACRFGGPACFDTGSASMCPTPSKAASCAPSADVACIVPEACSVQQCAGWASCSVSLLPFVTCTIAVTTVGGTTTTVPCPGATTVLDATGPALAPFLGANTCLGMFLMPKQDAFEEDTVLPLEGSDLTVSLGSATSCTNTLVGGGSGVTQLPNTTVGTLGLAVLTPAGDTVRLLVPLEIVTGACDGNQVGCVVHFPPSGSGSGSNSGPVDAGVDASSDAMDAMEAGPPPDAGSGSAGYSFPCP